MSHHHEGNTLPDDLSASPSDKPSPISTTPTSRVSDEPADVLQQNFQVLRDDRIIQTIEILEQRIGDRFPKSGLTKLCQKIMTVPKTFDN